MFRSKRNSAVQSGDTSRNGLRLPCNAKEISRLLEPQLAKGPSSLPELCKRLMMLCNYWRCQNLRRDFIWEPLMFVMWMALGVVLAILFKNYCDNILIASYCAFVISYLYESGRYLLTVGRYRAYRRSLAQAICFLVNKASSLPPPDLVLLVKVLPMLPSSESYTISERLAVDLRQQDREAYAQIISSGSDSLMSILREVRRFTSRAATRYTPAFIVSVLRGMQGLPIESKELQKIVGSIARKFKGEAIGEAAAVLIAEWSKKKFVGEVSENLLRASYRPQEERVVLLRSSSQVVAEQPPEELLRSDQGKAADQSENR